MAAFNHYFTPNFHDVIFGSYEQTSYGRAKNFDWTLGGLGDASEYRIGNQFLWDPVKNLEFGLEFDYMKINQTLAHKRRTGRDRHSDQHLQGSGRFRSPSSRRARLLIRTAGASRPGTADFIRDGVAQATPSRLR